MKRNIGLHLRCNKSVTELIKKATRLELPLLQCFLRQPSGIMVPIGQQDIMLYRAAWHNIRKSFVHGSYRINLADPALTYHPALKQELYWTRKLGFNHIILHPGSYAIHDAGIDSVARMLNTYIHMAKGMQFVLENVAFAAPSIGGAIEDLQAIRNKIDYPDRLSFCIDTAHAYAYGYDIATNEGRNNFIDLLGSTIGYNTIALIHINDTQSTLSARQDIHCRIGTGTIGIEALKEFALDTRLQHIPLVLELPTLAENEEKEDLEIVRSWFLEKA